MFLHSRHQHEAELLVCRNDTLSAEDVPKLIVALLLIAVDPASVSDVRMEIIVTIDLLSGQISGGSDGTSDIVRTL